MKHSYVHGTLLKYKVIEFYNDLDFVNVAPQFSILGTRSLLIVFIAKIFADRIMWNLK